MDFCDKYRISFDHFYRTSLPDHHDGAKKVWRICDSKGDIYKKHYEGIYCVGCEAFLLGKDLIDGKCLNHGIITEMIALGYQYIHEKEP
jgi:methionyl-tRNA synthetase